MGERYLQFVGLIIICTSGTFRLYWLLRVYITVTVDTLLWKRFLQICLAFSSHLDDKTIVVAAFKFCSRG